MPEGVQTELDFRAFSEAAALHRNADQVTYRENWPNQTIEDGIYLIEATANYDYASPKIDLEGSEVLTTSYTVENASEVIMDGASLTEAYNSLYEFIEENMDSNQELWFCDIALDTATVESTFLNATIVMGGGGSLPLACVWNENDYWYPAWLDGKCDGSGAFRYVKDGAVRIGDIVNCEEPDPICEGGNIYFTEVVTRWLEPPESFELYQVDLDYCLEPNEIAGDVAIVRNDIIPSLKPSGKVFLHCTMEGDCLTSGTSCTPFGQFTFAKTNCNPLDE